MANTEETTKENAGKVLLYMQMGASYTSAAGVRFTKDHPYQLVSEDEAYTLLKEDRFRMATARDLRDFYQLGEAPISLPLTTATFINGDPVPEA